MTQVVKIPYSPRQWARNFLHNTLKRFILIVIHRRGGKTTAALNHLNKDCLRHKKHRYAYVAPTYKQAKRIAWKMLKEYTKNIPGVKYNESELTVTYPNGSEMILLGAENPDSIRGIGLNGVILDEYAQISPVLFTEIITKCVADTGGYVMIIGTPKGKGHFFRMYEVAKKDKKNWECIFLDIDWSLKNEKGKTIQNLKNALEDDKRLVKQGLMTQAEYDQEWYNSWEAALKGAVYGDQLAMARSKKRIKVVPYDPMLPVYTVWDLGVRDAMAVGFWQRSSSGEMRLIDYLEVTGGGLPQVAKLVKNKPYVYGMHFFPFDIKVREQSTGKTRFATVERLFGEDKVAVVDKLPIEDGIDLARAMWNRMWIDEENCELFVDLIGSYVYEFDEKRGVFRPKPFHDFTSHAADMLRYSAVAEEQMTNEDASEEKTPEAPQPDDEYTGDLEPEWEEDLDDEGNPKPLDKQGLPSGDALAKMG